MNLTKIVNQQKQSNYDVVLHYYDDKLLFYPVLKILEKELTIREKGLECSAKTGWMQKVVYKTAKLYAELPTDGKTSVGITYQGFFHRLLKRILTAGLTFSIKDYRIANADAKTFPAPRLDLMKGFRFSQEKLLSEALLQNSSGLIGAPTRYGKTSLLINTARAFPDLSIVITAPGVDLVKQLYADLLGPRGLDPGREVKLICSSKGKKPAGPGGITVCSADSLNKIDPGTIDLVLADEPHALVTESRLRLIDAFPKARRIGFGATLKGRFDGRDQLIEGVFGHVLVERTYKEAVEEGAICPLHILFLKVEVEPRYFRDRNSAYNSILFHNQSAADLANEICTTVIPADFQTMIFVKDEKQAEQLQETMGRDTTIAMAKRMSNKEREECDRLMKENIIKRCLCTKIYVQGVTFSDVRVLINLEGGGNNTSAIQKPGRLAEIRPDKKCGIVIDLLFVPPGNEWGDYAGEEWIALCRDSKARKTAYEEKGYNITIVNNVQQLKEKFDELI